MKLPSIVCTRANSKRSVYPIAGAVPGAGARLSAATPGALVGDVADVVAIELVGVAQDVVARLVKEATLPGVFCLWSRGVLLAPPEL